MRVACIQNNAGRDWAKNWKSVKQMMERAVRGKAQLLVLPEFFYWRGSVQEMPDTARLGSPLILQEARRFAKEHACAILLGSLLEKSSEKNKYYNTSYLISESGKTIAKYRKIHLFDNHLKEVKTCESETIRAGSKVVAANVRGVSCGLSICYDLRFPELYRGLSKAGAKIFFVPANFTYLTGKAHWDILLKARAIENQAFVLAPGQSGVHPSTKIRSYGNSRILSPWGEVLASASTSGEEVIFADLDFQRQDKLRRFFPVLKHTKLL